MESVVEDIHNVFYILLLLEAVADDGLVFLDEPLRVQLLDEIDVESR